MVPTITLDCPFTKRFIFLFDFVFFLPRQAGTVGLFGLYQWSAIETHHPVVAFSASIGTQKKAAVVALPADVCCADKQLQEADTLFDRGQESVPQMYELLTSLNAANPQNAEILWRISRAARLMSMDERTVKEQKKVYAYECT